MTTQTIVKPKPNQWPTNQTTSLDCSKTKTKPMTYKVDYLDCNKTKTKPMTYKVDYIDYSKTKTKPRKIAW